MVEAEAVDQQVAGLGTFEGNRHRREGTGQARSAATGLASITPAVLSFVREWRTKEDEDENWVVVIRANLLSTPIS
jgi:hypothetical protein